MRLWRENKLAKNNTTTIDSDHEIEAFLQEYIVGKVIAGYEVNSKEVIGAVNELQQKINSIKNSSNTTNQDISSLI